jgi:endonuclease VIII-like 1
MPEYVELQLNAEVINSFSQEEFQRVIVYKTIGKNDVIKQRYDSVPFKVYAYTRGKELMLKLTDVSPIMTTSFYYRFNLGMSGMFYAAPIPPDALSMEHVYRKNTMFAFENVTKDVYLGFLDVRRFAKIADSAIWGKNRGPDPLKEEDQFRLNISAALLSKDFKKPIYEVLVNQKYFNGIGNVLRADILAQIDDTPFQSAHDWFSKHPDFCDTIVKHLRVTLGRRSSQSNDGQYGQGLHIIDKNNRKFWYNEKWK